MRCWISLDAGGVRSLINFTEIQLKERTETYSLSIVTLLQQLKYFIELISLMVAKQKRLKNNFK